MRNYRQQRNYENIEKCAFKGRGKYDIPPLRPVEYTGCEFIGFNYAKSTADRSGKGIHFFVDDYQFLRLWNRIDAYTGLLSEFKYVMAPDFSTYTDFPQALQIYNHYRKHWIGAYLQKQGVKVIPTISWSDEASFAWCFDGEPDGGTVAVSCVGTQNNEEAGWLFQRGYEEMIRRLSPQTILFYGQVPRGCHGGIVSMKAFQEKFTEAKANGW